MTGISEEPLLSERIVGLRIVSTTLVIHAILVLLFIYYYLMDRQFLAFFIGLFRNLISPLVLVVLLCVLIKSELGIWIGLAPAPLLALIVCAQTVYMRYSKEQFPFLLQPDKDQNIYIFDFIISPETCAEMARTADEIFSTLPVPAKVRMPAVIFIEDHLMLVVEKNPLKKDLLAECTIIAAGSDVRLIIRDSGRLFDVLEEDIYRILSGNMC
ncbi:MAG: hypothetical protein Q4D81_12725 [Eubacteriales bacterium]|nr:hypothetical protein [Eubacteriales bacterium]